jgi:hypothetical protein
MEPIRKSVLEQAPIVKDKSAFGQAEPQLDVEALQRQRIRFDALFTGPTW